MHNEFGNRVAKVLIVEESGAGRQLLSDVVRACGFNDVRVVATGADALGVLEVEEINWLLMPFLTSQPVNALHILQIIADHKELRQVRTSIIYDSVDEPKLDLAFALGLMSCHPRTYLRDEMSADVQKLMTYLKNSAWRAPLVAAEYLRRRLHKKNQYNELVEIERKLLKLFPGSAPLLLRLGEAQLSSGNLKNGLNSIKQAGIIEERMKEIGKAMIQKVVGVRISGGDDDEVSVNALGCDVCVLVDPDSAVLGTIASLIQSVGVPKVLTFEDGETAWKWIEGNPEPGLILQEWRIPKITGPLLLQRVRQLGYVNVPIIVASSVIKPNELPLLREMGVDNVIAKPYNQQVFFKNVIWSMQQSQIPTEQKALERRIRRLLDKGHLDEAKRLRTVYSDDARISTAAKKEIEAEFAYHSGRFRTARDLGVEALRLGGESLLVLNLIGKSLLKLGDHSAALKFFEKASSMSPHNIEHICNMAVSSFESGEYDQAQSLLNKAGSIDPENTIVHELSCQHAIIRGKTEDAKTLMGKLGSIKKVVGYMNNRAVALTKSGRYDEGIELYAQTMSSLPGEWSETHDIVAYNKGLALARYGELKQALEQLKPVVDRQQAHLHAKALSLSKRIGQADAAGTALPLFPVDRGCDDVSGDEDTRDVADMIAAALEVSLGEVCLKGIYELTPDAEMAKLLANPPRYKHRAVIERREAFHA